MIDLSKDLEISIIQQITDEAKTKLLKEKYTKARIKNELFSFDESLVTGFLLGCLSSATSYVLNMLFGDNGLKIEHNGVSFKKKTNYRRWK